MIRHYEIAKMAGYAFGSNPPYELNSGENGDTPISTRWATLAERLPSSKIGPLFLTEQN